MKTLSLALLFLLACHVMPLHAESSALKLSISVPSSPTGEHVLDPARISHFHVILSNSSDKPQRVWAPWSESGCAMLSFVLTDVNGKASQVKRREIVRVSHPLSEACVLRPEESLVIDVYFADSDAWEGFPVGRVATLSMRAVFEARPDPATEISKVWTGKVISEALMITILPKD